MPSRKARTNEDWCRGPDSNRHRHNVRRILSPLRLPIPPPRQGFQFFDPFITLARSKKCRQNSEHDPSTSSQASRKASPGTAGRTEGGCCQPFQFLKKDGLPTEALAQVGGGTRIRTGESGFCRPLPYHLAMPPVSACLRQATSGLRPCLSRRTLLHSGYVKDVSPFVALAK